MTEPEKILLEALEGAKIYSGIPYYDCWREDKAHDDEIDKALAAYEKAKDLTWEELCDRLLSEGWKEGYRGRDSLIKAFNGGWLWIYKCGEITTETVDGAVVLSSNRTPAQMLAILNALTEDGK